MKLLCLMLCLLLCGCAPKEPVASLTDAVGTEAQAQASMTLRCGIPAHALGTAQAETVYPLGDGFLLVGDTLTALDSRFLPVGEFEGQAFQFIEGGLACWLPQSRELVLLNHRLEESKRIVLPQEALGTPRVSQDGKQVWYTAENALRVWDLESGIRRRVKELHGPLTLANLLMEDTILVCYEEGSTLFLDAENGSTLRQLPGEAAIRTQGETFFTALPQSTRTDFVFGTADMPQTLLPRQLNDPCHFLPQQMAAVALHQEADAVILEYYDLHSGVLVDDLTLPGIPAPKGILPLGENQVLLLVHDPEFACDMLLTWTPSRTAPSTLHYTSPYYTAQEPDTAALAGCRSYARQIASKYGITILVGQEAAEAAPWDYELEPEFLERVLMENLKLLDGLLAKYPREVLTQTAEHFGRLNLSLVRQIQGTAASGSLATATGVHYLQNGESYVALALGPYIEQALYHELFHAMETCIFAKSTAFDHWDELNPAGFSYDYDFSANAQRNSGIYLESSHRAFVDTYSMSYPKEDRARILEYAMLSGNDGLFQTEVMQNKLQTVCNGIQEAYDLKEGPYLWEQYLK